MKILILILLLIAAPVAAEPVIVQWENPTESTDGTPVDKLAKFLLFRKIPDGWEIVGETSYASGPKTEDVFDLPCGGVTIAARVETTAGLRSFLSNRVDQEVDCTPENKKPKPPIIRISPSL